MRNDSRGVNLMRHLYQAVLRRMRWFQYAAEHGIPRRPRARRELEPLESRVMLSAVTLVPQNGTLLDVNVNDALGHIIVLEDDPANPGQSRLNIDGGT